MKNRIVSILSVLLCTNLHCTTFPDKEVVPETPQRIFQKFEPKDGACFLFIGQDLGAVGGVEGYSSGYCNSFDMPAGVTVYLGKKTEKEEVAGLYQIANWGSGDCCANLYPTTPMFANAMISIGYDIVGSEEKIVRGEENMRIDEMGNWIKSLSPRPVFLRIGYEFDGAEWNFYQPETYKPAYRYIKDRLDEMGITNVAYVWQSKGVGTTVDEMRNWYPGDDYVDWCSYSYFGMPDTNMIAFARIVKKPVFIAEATPVFQEDERYFDADIKKEATARKIWDEWFTNLFQVIEENSDVIKALAYINVDWYAQDMWIPNPTFQQCDSRIQMSPYVTSKWLEKISDTTRYIHANELDWSKLPQ